MPNYKNTTKKMIYTQKQMLQQVQAESETWLFAYGSLMWHREFEADDYVALLSDWQRQFCMYSYHFRGTPQKPGLVLALDRGGECYGRALRISADQAPQIMLQVWQREMILYAYNLVRLKIKLLPTQKEITAWTYVINHEHKNYAGLFDNHKIVKIISQARGVKGRNSEYLLETYKYLKQQSVPDQHLFDIYTIYQQRSQNNQ